MKIAIITSGFLPKIGGAEIVIHNIVKKMNEKGVDVTLYIPYGYYKDIKDRVPYKVRPTFFIGTVINRLPFLKRFFCKSYINILQIFNRYDIWHAHIAHHSGYCISFSKDIKKVLTFHGVDIQKNEEVNYGFRLYDKKYEERLKNEILPNIDILTAISKSVKRELLDLGVPENKIVMVPNGIDLDLLKDIQKSKKELKEEYGFKRDDFIILTSGRNHPKKGYKDIPYIVKELEERNIDFKWIIVGRGTEELKPIIKKLNIKNLILKSQIGIRKENPNFIFPDENMRKIYKMADIYAFPTIIEGLPMVILEAFASKLPVITTNVDGVEDFESCIKINRDKNFIKNFAEYIIRLKKDKNFRNKIVENQYKEVRNKYTLEKVVDKYLNIYENLLRSTNINGKIY